MAERSISTFIVMTLAASVIGCRTDPAPADLSPETTISTSTTEDIQSTQQEESFDPVNLSDIAPTAPIPACSIISKSSRDQTKAFNCKLEIE